MLGAGCLVMRPGAALVGRKSFVHPAPKLSPFRVSRFHLAIVHHFEFTFFAFAFALRTFAEAAAAFLASAVRASELIAFMRALPPFLPPFRPISRMISETNFLSIVFSLSAFAAPVNNLLD
jgi:hypothetical protein